MDRGEARKLIVLIGERLRVLSGEAHAEAADAAYRARALDHATEQWDVSKLQDLGAVNREESQALREALRVYGLA